MSAEENNKNIVLTGMPGAGKTYIGNKLAKILVHFDFVDIDSEIEKQAKMNICEIFEKFGQDYFRKLEQEIIEKFSKLKNQIIATGGGTCQSPKNVLNLKKNGIIFYLSATSDELFSRIKNETKRPLLNVENSLEEIKKLLSKRRRNYLKADFVIDTNKKQAYTILDSILKEYEGHVK
ncbi:MAG TPA: shikimate kinase [Candidatus Gastranaerophilaceae bacterium]|nr:shikimate kinase [Candidatus Gastranaerophilaceae bacterium]HPT41430.1 shikimate kinase [Candidatus Gastranaerophilaceae bacterium]